MSSEVRYRVAAEAGLAAGVALLTALLAHHAVWLTWPTMTTLADPAPLALAAGLAVALVLVRRRLPTLALLAAALLFGRFIETGVAVAVIAYAAAARAPVKTYVVAAALPVGLSLLLAPPHTWRQIAVVSVTISLVCVALPALLGLVLVQRERLLRALRERNEVLERAHELTAAQARLLERSRIAQEMHDLIGHRLSLVSLYAGGLELSADPPLAERARLVRDTAATAMSELRTVLDVLRTDRPGDGVTDATGTRADLEALAAESRATGTPVAFAWSGPDIGGEHRAVRIAAHRLVRESLTNLHRHAPGASCAVEVCHEPGGLAVRVENDRPAGPRRERSGGTGLTGLAERVRLLGGTFAAGPTPEGGFLVRAVLPWDGTRTEEESAPAAPPGAAGRRPGRWQRVSGYGVHAAALAAVAVLLIAVVSYLPMPSRVAMIELGMSDAGFRRSAVDSEPVAELAVAGHEPPRPPGSHCWYFYAGYDIAADPVRVARYCVGGGRIVDRRVITVHVGSSGRGE
ncbi:sensor histidine kinase [Nonomuraea longicatena]|uniref:histidine kinase n=1 Tax=Nonomuraea longicatena TaxID=83682 RepID=A0ABN1PLC2_9ACTN